MDPRFVSASSVGRSRSPVDFIQLWCSASKSAAGTVAKVLGFLGLEGI